MLEFNFDYKGHRITYKVDHLGRERCFLDDEPILKAFNSWFKSVDSVKFTLEGEELTLYRRVLSYQNNEFQLTLVNQEKIIEKQTQSQAIFGQEKTVFENEESDWIQEIEQPNKIFNIASVLYMICLLTMVASWGGNFEYLHQVTISLILAILLYTVYDVCKIGFNAIKLKPEQPNDQELLEAYEKNSV